MTGVCECGCGRRTRIAPSTSREKGWIKGQPVRFISGHNTFPQRHRGYRIEDRGYRTPCWVWKGKPEGENGYGRIVVRRKRHPAHRYFYERAYGAIPDGMQLDHLCRVPLCVNPEHLEIVTGTENVRRGNVAKLSVSAAREIRRYRDDFFIAHPYSAKGLPRKRFPQGELQKLATRYGVSKNSIIAVLRERTWL